MDSDDFDSDDLLPESQRFVEKEDDELFEVLEITGERARQFKVKWAGVDKSTGKPWPQSWVPKHDCTLDLVDAWRKKQRRKSTSGASKRASTASGSKSTRRSTSTIAPNPPKKRTRSSIAQASSSKKDRVDDESEVEIVGRRRSTRSSKANLPPESEDEDLQSPKKKKKQAKHDVIEEESEEEVVVRKPARRSTRSSKASLPSESEDEQPVSPKKKKRAPKSKATVSSEDEEPEPVSKPKSSAKSKPTGKKRKHDEATSANNSTKNTSRGDDRKPRKKRKIMGDVVKQEPDSDEMPEAGDSEDEADEELVVRDLSQVEVDEEEDEEEEQQEEEEEEEEEHPPPPKSPKKRRTVVRSSSPVAPPPRTEHRMPTEERSVFWDGADAGMEDEHEPVLSPNAQLQLEEFDRVMGLTTTTSPGKTTTNHQRKSTSVVAAAPQPVASSSKSKLPPSAAASSPVAIDTPAAPGHGNDYDENEIVPETDDSQQSQELQIGMQPSPVKPKSAAPPPQARDVSTTDKGKGKEKEKSKPLRPIPQLSPSVFYAHLSKAPQSSLPESITNASDDSRLLNATASQLRGASPIEQFDSPLRVPVPLAGKGKAVVDRKGKGKERERVSEKVVIFERDAYGRPRRESASEIWNSEVVQRGQQLAEAAKRRRVAEEGRATSPSVKRKLEEIIELERAKNGYAAKANGSGAGEAVDAAVDTGSESEGHRAEAAESSRQEEDEEEEEYEEDEPEPQGEYHPDAPGTSTLAIPPASEPHLLTLPDGFEPRSDADFDDSLTLEQMELQYVDLDGGIEDANGPTQTQTQEDVSVSMTMNIDGPPLPVDPTMLRQEEEESTQDVMMQFQVTRPSPPPVAAPPVMEEDEDVPMITVTGTKGGSGDADDGEESDSSQQLHVPKITIHPASRAASVLSYVGDDEPQPPARNTRSRSRSQTPAIPEPSGLLPKARKGSAPPGKRGGSVAPSLPPVLENTELTDAKALIASLQAQLASVQQKNTALEASVATLRPQVISLNKSLIDKQEWALREIAEAESTWMTQREEYEAALQEAEKGKADAEAKRADAEKDRDFFREQYAQASGFVSQVRDENKDLLKRIEIAEGQTQQGVALVRATFDERVKVLEADVKSWRRMAEFLMEKDRRSNNAEICKRAAEAPELRARCAQQAAEIADYEERVNDLEARAEESVAELERYRDQVVHLNAELDDLAHRLAAAGVITTSQEDGSGDVSSSHEMVYRCDYRPGDQRRQCPEVFSTLQELEQHVVGPHGHIRT